MSKPAASAPGAAAAGFVPALTVFLLATGYLLLRAPDASFFLASTDHGYQLAVAQAMLDGGLQGLDFHTLYGPLVGASSALARLLSGTLVGEVVLCGAGYALAVTLAFACVRRQAGNRMACAVALLLLVLIPRYYKWYYWLLPLAGLYLYFSYLLRLQAGRRCLPLLLGWGAVGGVGFLLRQDLGLAALLSALLLIAAAGFSRRYWPGVLVHQGCLVAGWLVPLLLWLGLLLWHGGPDGVLLHARSIVDASTDVVRHYAMQRAGFDLLAPMSQDSALAALHALVLLLYGTALVIGVRGVRARTDAQRRFALAVLGPAVVGLSVYPQGAVRADFPHLLQAIAPFVVLAGLLLAPALGSAKDGRVLPAGVAVVLAAWLSLAIVGGRQALALDLYSPLDRPLLRLAELAGLPESRAEDPAAATAIALRRYTRPGQRVFMPVAWTPTPILALAQRSLAGIIPVYAPGIMSGEPWRTLNRQALARHPPVVLVVETARWQHAPAGELAPYIEDLVEEWRATYTRVLHENARYRVLAPALAID